MSLMSTPEARRSAVLWLALCICWLPASGLAGEVVEAAAITPQLGVVLDAAAAQALPATIYPDGRGLPAGRGTVTEGAAIFAAMCVQCHGPEGQGGSAPELAGGHAALDSEYPDQNIGTYWPYATTVFDFLRRSMPMFAPGSLNDDQYYSLTAYLLERNGLWSADATLDAAALAAIRMPNRDGFDSLWPETAPVSP
jgi:S-disulfanyl-L-cysteine oxidoreductase SoxD